MTETEQVYKSDDLKLASFLLSRGCRVQDKKLRSDNRVDFFIVGVKTLDLVKEHEMGSQNTLVPVHQYDACMERLRDICSRAKREAGTHR